MTEENKKDILLQIVSYQKDAEGEIHQIKTQAAGQLFEREDALYILYTEMQEDGGNSIKNLLKIEEKTGRVSLKKSGAVSWKAEFEEGKYQLSEYQTPYGSLGMGVETDKVLLEKEEKKISLHLAYTLYIQEEKQAECRLEIVCTENYLT